MNKQYFLKLIKKNKFYLILILILAIYILNGFSFINWPAWTGFSDYESPYIGQNIEYFRGKTLWDWLELLIIPIALSIIAIWFTREENKRDRNLSIRRIEEQREIEIERFRDTSLQNYLDNMSKLILHEGLTKSSSADEVRSVARALTISLLPNLDNFRKSIILRFLYESKLLGSPPILHLHGADFSEVFLGSSQVDMSFINLELCVLLFINISRANFTGANFRKTLLHGALMNNTKLIGANFRESSLSEAKLEFADLRESDLTDADLSGAIIDGSDFTNAIISLDQLQKAKSLSGIILPDGKKYNSD